MVSFWIRMQRSEASTTARGADLVIVRGRTIWCRSGDETEENRGPFGRSRRRAELSREHSVFFTLNIFTNTWQYIAPAVVLITLKEFMYLHTYYTAYWYWKLPKPKLNEWLYKSIRETCKPFRAEAEQLVNRSWARDCFSYCVVIGFKWQLCHLHNEYRINTWIQQTK